MKIEKTITFSFEITKEGYSYNVEPTMETILLGLCLTDSVLNSYGSRLIDKKKRTKQDKHNLTCVKASGFLLRQLIVRTINDVKTINKNDGKKNSEIGEVQGSL